MAALGLNTRPRSSQHSSPLSRTPSRQLPRGSCNWKDLTPGNTASSCGCIQFWLNDAQLGHTQQLGSDGAWCFCGHHACFHSVKSHTSFETFEQHPELRPQPSWNFDEAFGLDFGQAPVKSPPASASQPVDDSTTHLPTQPKPLGINASALGLVLPDNPPQFKYSHPSQLPQPHFLEQAAASHLPSTQSSSKPASNYAAHTDFRQPHPPKPNNTTQVPQKGNLAPQLNVYNLPQSHNHDDGPQSATEIATPSNAGTPALRENDDPISALRTTLDTFHKSCAAANTDIHLQACNHIQTPQRTIDQAQPHFQPTIDQLMQQISWLKNFLTTTPSLQTSFLNLQGRVDVLENTSFSHIPAEEIQDKFENFDGRILEIEGRVDELETFQAAQVNDGMPKPNDSFASKAPTSQTGHISSHNLDSNPISHSAALVQLASLERRLSQLEATSVPTATSPWDIEVVFIPWSRDLAGIWSVSLDASQLSAQEAQHSALASPSTATQTSSNPVSTSGKATAMSQSHFGPSVEWTNGTLDWLSPRACGPSRGTAGQIYERLKSRGFVRSVRFCENSAKEVYTSILAAYENFEPLTDALDGNCWQNNSSIRHILGLGVPFIPLRKVHKSSRLRHLAAAELVTPSLWTPEFLNSGVFMQTPTTGHRRLYITTPSGYLQEPNKTSTWTWQKLRELPRYHPDIEAGNSRSFTIGEADANEPCWAWNARLDPAISVHSSFSSYLSYHSSLDSKPLSPQRTNAQSSGLPSELSSEFEGASDEHGEVSVTHYDQRQYDKRSRSPITPTSENSSNQRRRERCANSQPPTQMVMSPATTLPKRQVASFEAASPVRKVSKRRRISQNTNERGFKPGWNLTPRQSHEPVSPCGQNSALGSPPGFRQDETMQYVSVKQGTTPQAYATPYSGDVFIGDRLGEYSQDTDFDESDADENRGEDVDVEGGNWGSQDVDISYGDGTDDDDMYDDNDEEEEEEEEDDDEAWEGVEDEDHEK